MASFGPTGISWIATSPWVYPTLEVVHIAGIAALVGNLLLFELRVWGAGADLPVRALARLSLSLALVGFALAGASGLMMFVAHPAEMLANRAFVIKMALLMLAGLNAASFHARDSLDAPDRMARAQTLLSIGLWIAVIACGRWIAYI